LGLGFIDGSVSWEALSNDFRKPFPIVIDIYIETLPDFSMNTIVKYILKRTIGIQVHFTPSKLFL
jgi:hypothetical protein